MRRLLLLIAVTLIGVPEAPAGQRAGGEEEIKKLVLELTAAYKADLPKYFSYYAPDTQMWWPTGRVDKKGYQDRTAKREPLAMVEASDIQVQMAPSGDAAVATYILTIQNNAQAPVRNLQMTLVWFRREGKWQAVHLHYQPKQEKPPSGDGAKP